MTIRPLGTADRLVGCSPPACIRPELHTPIQDDGVMRMRQVETVEVAAGRVAKLKRAGST